MNEALLFLNSILTDDTKDMLSHIYEPKVVSKALSDARRDVMVMPDGEIREYGYIHRKFRGDPAGRRAYQSSRDCGISWTLHYDRGKMGTSLYIPERGLFIKAKATEDGTYVLRSAFGPDDPDPRTDKISDDSYFCEFLPERCEGTNRIFFTAQRKREDGINIPAFIYSDDFGDSFHITELPPPPRHEQKPPHKGIRWSISNGSEPCAIDLGDRKILMLIRTSTDYFYQAISNDGGETFETMEKSPFHGTNTTAFLLKLSDGRILALWNNTQPLPEEDHEKQTPPLPEDIKDGTWEDVFTNRDSAHAAISEDGGKTFIGYREILLNPVRNAEDFRYTGNPEVFDKSVHQFQAIELPMNKVLVAAGQNEASRSLLIFDLDWLYETEREESFMRGLRNVTTHTYLKSIPGSTMDRGNGHCAYNRIPSAVMMPDPDGGYLDRPFVSQTPDERLLYRTRGIIWNFPAARKGSVRARIKLLGKATVTLSDRWFNACDEYAGKLSPISFEIAKGDKNEGFCEIRIDYDLDKKNATLFVDNKKAEDRQPSESLFAGVSYLILQCKADKDEGGFYLEALSKK